MFKKFRPQINLFIDNFNALEPNEKKKRIAILAVVVLTLLILGFNLIQTIINSTRSGPNNSVVNTDARTKVEELGNPFGLPKTSLIVNYPFIIKKKITDKLYLIEVNTSMLNNPYYNNLFIGDNNLRNGLVDKPFTFIDTYQALYNLDQDKTINPFQRMTNFNIITLQGEDFWFMEEGDDYWISKPNFEQLRRVSRNTNMLPSFKRLVKVGPNKFVTSTKGEGSQSIKFITLEIFPDATSRSKETFVNLDQFYEVKLGENSNISLHAKTPLMYAFNGNNVMHRISKDNEDIFVVVDITDNIKPKIIEKNLRIREKDNIFITCSVQREKCWIYNPSAKTIVEINPLGDTANLNPLIDVDLQKVKDNTSKTFVDDNLIRYNEESNEILFFYQESWKPLYRF